MKKTFVMVFVFLLALSLIVAQPEPELYNDLPPDPEGGSGDAQPEEAGQPDEAKKDYGPPFLFKIILDEEEQEKEQTQNKLPEGLNTALQNVENEVAREMIERNLNRFQEKFQERLQNMEEVEVEEANEETGEVKIKAKEEVRFLGFIKGKATKRFEINNNGQITEKQPWYRFLYKNVDAEETAEE